MAKPNVSKVPAFFSKITADLECAVIANDLGECDSSKVSLGDPMLDWALGGGIAKNRLVVFAGQSLSGKSFMCAKAAGKIQQESDPDAWVVWLDAEYFLHKEPERIARLTQMGIDLKRCLIISSNKPDVIFSKLDAIETAMQEKEIKVCAMVIDSLGGLEDKAAAAKYAEGEIESAGDKFGGMAKFIGTLVKKLVRMAAENNMTVCLVQHAIVDMAGAGKGPPKYIVTGGQRLRLLCDTMVLSETVERKDALLTADNESVEFSDKGVVATGKTIRYKCLKSRFCMEGRTAETKINFSTCEVVRTEDSLCALAKLLGILTHPANAEGKINALWWKFSFAPDKYQGEKQVLEALKDKTLYGKVLAACMEMKDTPIGYQSSELGVEVQ